VNDRRKEIGSVTVEDAKVQRYAEIAGKATDRAAGAGSARLPVARRRRFLPRLSTAVGVNPH